ncbi:hypothetical protein [Pelagibacterium xiamenense]|uniref:hypothetical protein n=1 Tax=Pelagibacterium xiamenense TaxID=2901140 RepID=UPI001E520D98|nr:hypothetical protein [Pelagibacterium xiamenense]MCD7058683.1 hypothetical protein [Pelagibacterium xiamenense]
MNAIYARLALVYFVTATIFLMALAGVLLITAVIKASAGVLSGDPVNALLDSIGIVIIGFAVVETAKFIAEEEIVRKRELRSSVESRRSITKFITIIVIAASLEALVMVFKANTEGLSQAIYPAILLTAAMFALIALGSYQWFSSHIEHDGERRETAPQLDESDDSIRASERNPARRSGSRQSR